MPKKIIIVDDEPQISKLLTAFLEQKVNDNKEKLYKVLIFNSGNACIDYLKNDGDADLIVSDMRMPDGSGVDILNHIKGEGKDIPFLFMTGFSGDIKEEDMISLGAKKVYSKPFKCREMVAEFENFLKAS